MTILSSVAQQEVENTSALCEKGLEDENEAGGTGRISGLFGI